MPLKASVPAIGPLYLCAIVRDEAEGLAEWIAYHHLIGIDHFVIYDNGSTDGTAALLDRFAAAGILTRIDWPDRPPPQWLRYPAMLRLLEQVPDPRQAPWRDLGALGPQITAYNDALSRFGDQAAWMLFIDADEFLLLPRDGHLLPFLRRICTPQIGAIGFNWRYFGSAGQNRPDGRLVIERFTRCAAPDFPGHAHIKTLARTAALERMAVHAGMLRPGYSYVNDCGDAFTPRDLAFSGHISLRHSQLNHYSVKSRAEFERKRARGNATLGSQHPQGEIETDYFQRQDLNDAQDARLADWAGGVREHIGRLLGTPR